MTKDQSTSGGFHLHNYQDDLDAAEDKSTVDEFTLEETGELSEESGVSKQALKEDFGSDLDIDDQEHTKTMEEEDTIEDLEDRDKENLA